MTVPIRPAPDLAALIGAGLLDPARTAVTLRTEAMWLMPVTGANRVVGGGGRSHPDGTMTRTVIVDAASWDTGNSERDHRLRSVDFLDTRRLAVVTAELELNRGAWGVRSTAMGAALTIGVHLSVHFDKESAPR